MHLDVRPMCELIRTDAVTKARRGRLTTAYRAIETPAFVPVGTQRSAKAVRRRELQDLDAQISLGDTYNVQTIVM